MANFSCQLDTFRITWEETLNEMLSVLGWPMGSLWEINLCIDVQRPSPLWTASFRSQK